MGCCLSLLGCKPSKVRLDGDVIVNGVNLGFVDVELIPEEPGERVDRGPGRPLSAA